MSKRPHISPSQLNMISNCGEQWRRRYEEGEIIPPGIAMMQGTGVHAGAAVNFKQKIESHEDLPAKDIIDASVSGMTERIREDGILFTEDEQAIGEDVVVGKAIDTVKTLATLHASTQAPDYQPIENGVEQWMSIEVPNATHDLFGIVDLLDDKHRVVDIKTAAKTPSKGTADSSIQLTFYAAAKQVKSGMPASEVRLDTLVNLKTPKRHIDVSHRGADDFRALSNRVNAALAVIKAGTYAPANPNWWGCDPRYCGFHATCPYVNPNVGKKRQGD